MKRRAAVEANWILIVALAVLPIDIKSASVVDGSYCVLLGPTLDAAWISSGLKMSYE